MNNERYKREYKGLATLLTRLGILPPSRSSLASYVLEYGGALRMIRVSIFSNDLMPRVMPGGEAGAGLYKTEGPT